MRPTLIAALLPLAACSEAEPPVVTEGNLADQTVVEAGEEQGLVGRGAVEGEAQGGNRSE